MRARKLVVAALVREAGRVLMSRRRPDQAMPNLWEFPGGKVEPGEHPEAALIREVVFHAYEEFDLYMLVYATRVVGGTPRAIQVAEVAWVPAAELPALDLLPADYPLARKLASAGS